MVVFDTSGSRDKLDVTRLRGYLFKVRKGFLGNGTNDTIYAAMEYDNR